MPHQWRWWWSQKSFIRKKPRVNELFQDTRLSNQPPEAQSHLGLVMAKLAGINFNLEPALERTWPRTLQNGGRVLLLPLLPQIGPMTYVALLHRLCCGRLVYNITKTNIFGPLFGILVVIITLCILYNIRQVHSTWLSTPKIKYTYTHDW